MFDKISNLTIEAVHLNPQTKSNWRGQIIPLVALLVSASSAMVSYTNLRVTGERVSVIVQRNVRAEITAALPLGVEMIGGLDRTDIGFITEWNVSVINTSTTASSLITDFRLENYSASAAGSIFSSDESTFETNFRLADSSGSEVRFPIEVKPGAIERLVVTAPTSVSADTFRDAPPKTVPASKGGFYNPGIGALDPFGNKGRWEITHFKLDQDRTAFREPCIIFEVTTGRGEKFSGTGFWYRYAQHVVKLKGSDEALIPIRQSCPSEAPGWMRRLYFNTIKKVLRSIWG